MKQFLKKYHYQFNYILLALFLTCFHPLYIFSSDSYFMIAQGKDILNGGLFRTSDIFSVHDGFAFLHQKWLMCIETYFVYSLFGNMGLVVMSFILFFLGIGMMIYILEFFMPRHFAVNIPVLVMATYVLAMFSAYRPQMIAFLLLCLLLLGLEKYVNDVIHTKSYYVLFFLISLFMMWYHSTLWIFTVVFWLPYFCDFSGEYKHNKPELLKVLVAILAASICQPNGIKQYSYMWNCMRATSPVYLRLVGELKSNPTSIENILIYVLSLLCLILWIWHEKFNLRAAYMLIGAVGLSIISYRFNIYAVLLSVFAIAISNAGIYPSATKWQKAVISLSMMFTVFFSAHMAMSTYNETYYKGMLDYGLGQKAVNTLTANIDNPSDVTLCCIPADVGSFAISQGYRVYFDCRAEMYDIAINKHKDILSEYLGIIGGKYNGNNTDTFMMDFNEDYSFDYYVVSNRSDFVIDSLSQYAFCNYSDECYSIYSFTDDRIFKE